MPEIFREPIAGEILKLDAEASSWMRRAVWFNAAPRAARPRPIVANEIAFQLPHSVLRTAVMPPRWATVGTQP
jgi:hypothetical protein